LMLACHSPSWQLQEVTVLIGRWPLPLLLAELQQGGMRTEAHLTAS